MRDLIEIDEALCDGCGECVTACAERALAIVDGKARLISEVYCDGLGACLGHCPQGAIRVVRRDASPFDEEAVRRHITGARTPDVRSDAPAWGVAANLPTACSSARPLELPTRPEPTAGAVASSSLTNWPIQLHLLSPAAPAWRDADVLLAADCVAFAMGSFHHELLGGRSLAVACPKLDQRQEVYVEKLTAMIDEAAIRSLAVAVMEVPCCGGLERLAIQAMARSTRRLPAEAVVVGVHGAVIRRRGLSVS